MHPPAMTNLECNNNLLTNLDVSNNPSLVLLECSNNLLTNLDVRNTALEKLYCQNNQLTTSALNTIFGMLNSNKLMVYIEGKQIYIQNNPGTNDCNRSIATDKGWAVY